MSEFVEPKAEPDVIRQLFADHPSNLKKRIAELEAALRAYMFADNPDNFGTPKSQHLALAEARGTARALIAKAEGAKS